MEVLGQETPILRVLGSNDKQKVNIRLLNKLARENNNYAFFLDSDQKFKTFAIKKQQGAQTVPTDEDDNPPHMFTPSKYSNSSVFRGLLRENTQNGEADRIKLFNHANYPNYKTSTINTPRQSLLQKELIIKRNSISTPLSQVKNRLKIAPIPTIKRSKRKLSEAYSGSHSLNNKSKVQTSQPSNSYQIYQFSPQFQKKERLSTAMKLQRLKQVIYNGRTSSCQTHYRQVSQLESSYGINAVHNQSKEVTLKPRYNKSAHRRSIAPASKKLNESVQETEWSTAPLNLINDQIEFKRPLTNLQTRSIQLSQSDNAQIDKFCLIK